MGIVFAPIGPLGAVASGVDTSQALGEAGVRAIEAGMDEYGVLVFRKQLLTEEQQLDFARQFGPLDIGFGKVRNQAAPGAAGRAHRLQYRELGDISNLDMDGQVAARNSQKIVGNLANQLWHSDSSFQKPRAKYSMLYALVVPGEGGDTEFADLRLAYDALPARLKKQVEGLVAQHHPLHSRFMLGDTNYTQEQRDAIQPTVWPLVHTDPRTGRKILYVGAHAAQIEGMGVAEGRMLLMDLLEHATQRAHVYTHQWQVGDLIMWDNTATSHRGRWFDLSKKRELRRSTTEDYGYFPT